VCNVEALALKVEERELLGGVGFKVNLSILVAKRHKSQEALAEPLLRGQILVAFAELIDFESQPFEVARSLPNLLLTDGVAALPHAFEVDLPNLLIDARLAERGRVKQIGERPRERDGPRVGGPLWGGCAKVIGGRQKDHLLVAGGEGELHLWQKSSTRALLPGKARPVEEGFLPFDRCI